MYSPVPRTCVDHGLLGRVRIALGDRAEDRTVLAVGEAEALLGCSVTMNS